MELSVRKRISRILENQNRVMELAGVDRQYSDSDPEAGVTAPTNAYEDNWAGLQKRFGKDIIDKIELFAEGHMNDQLVQTGTNGTDLQFKKSPSSNPTNQQAHAINLANEVFIRFGGYMHDARNYVFNVGFKSSLGQDVFTFRFVMDINGNLNNWQPTGLGS